MYYYWRKIKPFVALLLLAGVVYGAIKGWMYYNARQAIEQLSTASAGQLEIRYDAIETELAGAVTVQGVSLVPVGAPQPVHIDRVRVSGPQLVFFLWGRKRNDPPTHMRIALEGIRIALDKQLFSALRRDLPEQPDTSPQGCDVGDNLDPDILRELGFDELQMDASLSYDYDKAEHKLRADMALDIAQLERMQADVALSDVAPDALEEGMNSIPSLASMNLSYRVEPAFGRRYLAACAKRVDQDVDTYRKARVGRALTKLAQAGVRLGPGLTRALQDYHQSWGEVRVFAEPAKPVNMLAMMFSPPQNWVDQLGIRVKLNRREITDLSFAVRPSSAEELAILLGQEPPPNVRSKPKPRYHYVYRPARVSQLSSLIGAKVRLYLNNDQPVRSGVLVGLTEQEARVEQRLHSGSITAHVPLSEISRVEVQRLEQMSAKR
jgi:hypothetical protein